MIDILAVTIEGNILNDLKLEQLNEDDILWYWVDFSSPSDEEVSLLDSHFNFHHLAIEDCQHLLQRPKLDYYDNCNFFVLHVLNKKTLSPEEIDLFIGKNFIVSFHLQETREIPEARQQLVSNMDKVWDEGHIYAAYLIMDKIVDRYFPVVYKLEDKLNELDNMAAGRWSRNLIEQLFDIREELIKLRRTVNAMRDLLYRILNSTHLKAFKTNQVYFTDIYDHLLKLSDMIEANRDITADIRDSYISINSDRMNTIMTVLTIMTAIFAPLTFIVGIYGMNFENMPELTWQYGYFLILGLMLLIGFGMFLWFKKKGWFDLYK